MLFKAEVFHEIPNQRTLLYTFVWNNEFSISAYLTKTKLQFALGDNIANTT